MIDCITADAIVLRCNDFSLKFNPLSNHDENVYESKEKFGVNITNHFLKGLTMNKIPWIATIVCVAWIQCADAASPPMVEKHVFTPGTESEKEVSAEIPKPVSSKELQKQLVFSGVIIGPKGKRALIRETGSKPVDPAKPDAGKTESAKNKSFGVGEQIKGLTIKDIGSNYLILAGQEGETKLSLYRGEKTRPVPPVIAQEPPQHLQPPGQSPMPTGLAAGPGQPNSPDQTPPSPGADGGGPAVFGPGPDRSSPGSTPDASNAKSSPSADAPPPNPFADVLKKAAERRANRVADQPVGGPANPFMNLQQ